MKKILIVDDNKEGLYLLESLLEGFGHEVVTAANGVEALEKLHHNSIHMVISDILMPMMDGFQLCRAMREDEQMKDVLFVFYTATYTEAKDEKLALKLGADKFIRKPMEPDELVKIISDLIRNTEKGEVKPREQIVAEEEKEIFKLYSTRLVSKLEKKILELEKEISKRKRVEEELQETNLRLEETLAELRQTQQQVIRQESLRALGQLASGIAHDFNNALTPILSYSELLLTVPKTLADKAKVKHHLELINTTAKDAVNIVNRLRELYRQRQGDEIFQPVNLNQLTEKVIDLTQSKWTTQAQSRGIAISVRTDLQKAPLILGNASELRSVLTNLVFNAVDAMPKGGTITIRTYRDGEHVVLEVSDTGVGMTDEVKQRCFEPFFSTKDERGTGLGLSIVHSIIQRHEGTIDISSEPGEGTTVIIRLPIQEEERAEGEGHLAEYNIRSLHVLLVEDEPRVRDAVALYLFVDGHTCETASNGLEGLSKFYAGSFDVVITDIAMPEMNGIQLAAAIKEIAPNKPIIMLTGFGNTMKELDDIPDVDYLLNKPVTLGDFRKALAKAHMGF